MKQTSVKKYSLQFILEFIVYLIYYYNLLMIVGCISWVKETF